MCPVERTPLTLKDFIQQRFIRDPQVSPDGSRVAFVVERFRNGEDDRVSDLWLARLDGPTPEAVPLTRTAASDSHPRWSPDGRWLAFLSARPDEWELAEEAAALPGANPQEDRDDKPKTQVWCLDTLWGGEPRQLTRRQEGVTDFAWSPNSRHLAVVSRDPTPEQAAYLKALADKKQAHPVVINRVQHKYDGTGFLDNVATHLFRVDVRTREAVALTTGPASESAPVWSPDGAWVLFRSNRTGDADNNSREDLWMVRIDGGEGRRITRGDVAASGAVFSPDGAQIAFVSGLQPENSYGIQHLMLVETADGLPLPVTGEAQERRVDWAATIGAGWERVGGVVPDDPGDDPVAAAHVYPVPASRTPARVLTEGIPGPVYGDVVWTDRGIRALAADHGRTRLLEVRAESGGGWTFLAPENDDRLTTLDGYHQAGGQAVAIVNRPDQAQEIWTMDADGRLVAPETHLQEWLDRRITANYRWVEFSNPDGQGVSALVAAPPGFVPGGQERLPVLVNIHGGPMAYDAPRFQFDEQIWAAAGYLVLMVNYRGSTSYGEAWCRSIQGDWGPREHADVMAGVDYVIAQGWADPERLFCTGFSQGGIMTNWAVGHTDRFRAAVSEHGMWNYVSAFGTDDCHLWWQDDLGVPWQNAEQYLRISPMSGLGNIRTPLLITAGEHDWRCPLNQAEELYVALKKRGVPTELIVYRDEHHAITRPSRARDRLQRILEWLERYGGPAAHPVLG
jgi:dipeptidyl aminopeptidase/acylaminoacyl peptidase